MAESTLTAAYADILREIARYMGVSSTDEATLCGDILKAGQRKFFNAHDWKFLRPTTTLTTVARYGTGTVEVTLGVVTLTGGTFPSWAANGELILDGVTYTVATRDSGTQLTLDDLTADADALTTYELAQAVYDLPDAFGAFLGPLTYRPGSNVLSYGPIQVIDERRLREMRQCEDVTGPPIYAALTHKTLTMTVGQRKQITFWPLPDAAYVFTYPYRVNPDALTVTNIYTYGGLQHSETLLLACLAAAEMRRHDGQMNAYEVRFQEALAASVQRDSEDHAPDRLGRLLDPSECEGDRRAEWPRIDRGSAYPPYTD